MILFLNDERARLLTEKMYGKPRTAYYIIWQALCCLLYYMVCYALSLILYGTLRTVNNHNHYDGLVFDRTPKRKTKIHGLFILFNNFFFVLLLNDGNNYSNHCWLSLAK